ncbi:MAG TPA: hypothetical protein PLP29_03755 [Candidatus Ozemobacteraceae bacterium]|nr:hypothetical protein [Candidatus Ozemobacteraceae bacterium]
MASFRNPALGGFSGIHIVMLCFLLALLGFFAADRMTGKTVIESGLVTDKKVKTSTTRSHGKTKTRTSRFLHVQVSPTLNLPQSVDQSDYDAISIGDTVELIYTVGGFTGSRYLKKVRKTFVQAERAPSPPRK